MPEGPSILILREEAAHLQGMRITQASGNTRLDKTRFVGATIVALRSWGKHFLIDFGSFSLRVHFLLFGSYAVDSTRAGKVPRLSLSGTNGELNLYTCALRFIEQPLDEVYDWRTDVMADAWSAALARRKLREQPGLYVCDALLDQDIFAGVGNIIKNEVLFRIRVHPLSRVGALPADRRNALVREARIYAFEFLAWKKQHVLRQHWLAHTKSTCPRCALPFAKGKLGKTQRRSFYCTRCQVLYDTTAPAAATRRRARAKA